MNGKSVDSTYACFFDFMSCFQKGPDGKRTDKEMALFGSLFEYDGLVWSSKDDDLQADQATETPERLQIPGRHEAEYGGLRGFGAFAVVVSNLVKFWMARPRQV